MPEVVPLSFVTAGALLPAETLRRIANGDEALGGLRPADYHLPPGERLNEAISSSWSRLTVRWAAFQDARASLPADDPGTTATRERWLLPLFAELGFGRLQPAKAIELDGKSYPVSHVWGAVPIHLLGCGVDLETRTKGLPGAARLSPHGLLQTLLNHSPDHRWGIVTNGLKLRLLRDNASLSRQAYVEFDLTALFGGEQYADFRLFWLLLHQSRFEAETPLDCALERWAAAAKEEGTRLFEQLRGGVEKAIEALGSGFLSHPANAALRDALRTGRLGNPDLLHQLRLLVYRFLFLFVAEDRGLLHPPGTSPAERDIYGTHYGTRRLRALARRVRGTRHGDLWESLRPVFRALGEGGEPALGLPALGGFLFSPKAAGDLDAASLANADLLPAVASLSFTADGGVRRPVDFRNLGADELGSVYESLLELHGVADAGAGTFTLETAAGHERKTTGSYYTPESLVSALLDTALDPVLDAAAAQPDPEKALLSLKICDPACGSGHFLLAAAHRLAHRLAAVRTGDDEPAPEPTRRALRDVIGRCIYGADLSPMAVELCKVSLWLETLDPGRPLAFLDHHIRTGNSLLGTTPELVAAGIPDGAYDALDGDDKAHCTRLRKINKADRKALGDLFAEHNRDEEERLRRAAAGVDELPDDTLEGVVRKEKSFAELLGSPEYVEQKRLFDSWCAAFVLPKTAAGPKKDASPVPTTETLRAVADGRRMPAELEAAVEAAARDYRFFHWHLAFPEVFERGGFDAVIGNPPWERIKLQEKEFFAARRPEIAAAPNQAARRKLIAALEAEDPPLYAAYRSALRQSDAESLIARSSGRYPLCGRGDINTYAVFAETFRLLAGRRGRAGAILPTGIATDATTQHFFADLVETRSLVSLFDFVNDSGLFPGVGHGRQKFCVLTMAAPGAHRAVAEFAFFLHDPLDLRDPERRFELTAADIALLNPNTKTCPIFQTRRDAEITRGIYHRVPVLVKEGPPVENPWGVSFARLFDMSNDSSLFRTRQELQADGWKLSGNVFERGGQRYLPLYEAKMLHHFTHRWGDYALRPEGSQDSELPRIPAATLDDPAYVVQPKYWVPETEVEARLAGKWSRGWLMGFRDICRSTDERTVVASVFPRVGVGNKIPLILSEQPTSVPFLAANLASLAFDFAARQKIGGTTLNFFIFEQLPVMPPSAYAALADFLIPRILELTHTANDVTPFARDLGYDGPPFRWNEERRFLLRAELDAAFFHLYGISREDADYILDTFPIVCRKDEARFGEYRTKRVILEIYDRMAEAARTGQPYATLLDPPPADPRCAHGYVAAAAPVLPFRRVEPKPGDEYRTCVPLLSLAAAAGAFREGAEPEIDGWVEPATGHRLRKGMFVARVTGRSMEPDIPDGSYALFVGPVEGSRTGRTLLVQQLDASGAAALTLKRFDSSGVTGKASDTDTPERTGTIHLKQSNPDAPAPRPLDDRDEATVQVIAELLEVLDTERNA